MPDGHSTTSAAIGAIHLSFPILMLAYVVAVPSTRFDPWIFVYLNVLALHWVLLDGECAISYAYKRVRDPSYAMGDSSDLDDERDFLRLIGRLTGAPFDVMNAIAIALNYIGILALLVRILVVGSVRPAALVVAYMVASVCYIAALRLVGPKEVIAAKPVFASVFLPLTLVSIGVALRG